MKRLANIVPVLLGVSLLTFILFHVVGGNPAYLLAGKNASPEHIQSIEQQLGLDSPLVMQYLDFLRQSVFFDWGQSWHTGEKIGSMILKGLGPTLSLTVPAFFISFFLSLLISLFSSYSRNSATDDWVVLTCLAGMSMSFLVYIICLQYLLSFLWGWFPINGWNPSWSGRWPYLFLPWLISTLVTLGPNVLIFRSVLLDQVDQDYVRTAKAKGLTPFALYGRHIFKNSLIPIITVAMMQLPFLITGSLLLEAFFGIPGLGSLLIQAIQHSDFPLLKAFTMIVSILYIFFNLLADYLYQLFDPRVELK